MRFGVSLFVVLGVVASMARVASAATCFALRPTSNEADWSYAGAVASSYATPEGHFRVWFATAGRHAPPGADAAAPLAATLAGAAAETALVRYGELGFRAPLADTTNAACPENGGDERFDIYLFDFGSADGTVLLDRCSDDVAETCAGFMIVENDFSSAAYASMAEGFRTVVPHELFHLVQHAYSSNDEAWWAEGSAQWATKQVFPELLDLEAFLPAFFQRPERALDFPPIGAAAGISYGAAIWPVFLSERVDGAAPRRVFEALGAGAPNVLDATTTVLDAGGDELATAYAEFARWNAATGARAGAGGYAHAASYPVVALEALADPLPSRLSDKLAGLAARYFSSSGGVERAITLVGDSARVQAWFLPLEQGTVSLARATQLPTTSDETGVIVVTGKARDRRDVSFALEVTEVVAPVGEAGSSSGGAASSEGGEPATLAQGGAGGVAAVDGGAGGAAHTEEDVEETPSEPRGGSPSEPSPEPQTKPRARGCAVAAAGSNLPLSPYAFAAVLAGAAWSSRRSARRALEHRSVV